MPLAAAIPAVIGAGASIYSASQQSKAASKANKAQQAAAQQQLAAQQANFDRIDAMNQPLVQGRNAAFDQILTRLGVTGGASSGASYGGAGKTPGGSAGTSPLEGASQGGPDFNAYFNANPDLGKDPSLMGFNPGDLTGDGQVDNADRGAWHYQNYGQPEGRALPTQAAQPAAPEQPTPAVDPNAAPDLMNARRPDAQQAPQYQRAPGMSAPSLPAVRWEDIANDPGFKFETAQTASGVNANFAARGALRGGASAKALQDRLFGVAHSYGQDYANRAFQTYDRANQQYQYGQNRTDNVFADDRAYDTSKWQFDTQRQDQNFNLDRNYQTNRWDTQTGNLFDVVNVGSGAAGQIAGAGTNNANTQSNIFGSQAQSTADAAYAKASANAQGVGALAGVAGNMFANWGGGSAARVTPGMMQQPWSAGSSANPFVNTPSSIRPVF